MDEEAVILGRLEAKVDTIIENQKEMRESHGDLELRVRGLENARAKLLGIAMAGAGLISLLIKFIA